MPNQYSFPYSLQVGLASPQPNLPFNRVDLLSYTGNNVVQSSRYINPLTKDFEVSANNHLQGMNAIDQSVFLAINNSLNSSAQLGQGQGFITRGLIPANGVTGAQNLQQLTQQMTLLLNQCLSFQLSNQQITITSVVVAYNSGGQIQLQFVYINNSNTQQVQQQYNLSGVI